MKLGLMLGYSGTEMNLPLKFRDRDEIGRLMLLFCRKIALHLLRKKVILPRFV